MFCFMDEMYYLINWTSRMSMDCESLPIMNHISILFDSLQSVEEVLF
jgi:hypothetical protein